MIVESWAPVRVDFAGAWTDVRYFYEPFGGATLNAAIDRYVFGKLVSDADKLEVTYKTDVPAGSGLGTSAAMNVVWLSLIKARPIKADDLGTKEVIAASAYDVERVLGIVGGKQDQYASAVGGINLFEFRQSGVVTSRVNISQADVALLESLLVLCYTGQMRMSSAIHAGIWSHFQHGSGEEAITAREASARKRILEMLFALRDSAYEGRQLLQRGQLDRFGPLLSVQFDCMKQLDAATSNPTIESLFQLVAADIAGGKPCGAGGGGCILFCCKEPALKAKVQSTIRSAGYRVLDFRFDFDGLRVRTDDS